MSSSSISQKGAAFLSPHTPFSMATGIFFTAATETSEEHHEVTAKWAAPSMGGKKMLSLTKPTSASERPMLRRKAAIVMTRSRAKVGKGTDTIAAKHAQKTWTDKMFGVSEEGERREPPRGPRSTTRSPFSESWSLPPCRW